MSVQVTALALYALERQAYDSHVLDLPGPDHPNFEDWVLEQKSQPQFLYWHQGLELELTTLQFVKSIRNGDFNMYIQPLEQLMNFVFALDRTNYKRSLTVHLRDMISLKEIHESVHNEFMQGHFVGQKSGRSFSSLALDQMHEQLICELKGNGGFIGLTENPAELRRHLIVGPELSRLIQEFERQNVPNETKHHEQYHSFQKRFADDVLALIEAFQALGNPFLEESGLLIELDGSIIMSEQVIIDSVISKLSYNIS